MKIQGSIESALEGLMQLRTQHDHLATTLVLLRRMCRELQSEAVRLPELYPELLLGELYYDLKQHFAAEESRDHFGHLVIVAPSLAPRIAAFVWQHAALLATIERLVAVAGERQRWGRLAPPTLQLLAELERHQRAQYARLREGLASRS